MDFNQYTPPGVYVTDESQPIVTATNAPSGLICLVGPASGALSNTEILNISSASDTALAQRGIYMDPQVGPPAIAGPVVTIQSSGVSLIQDIDYVLNVTSGTGRNAVTSITRVADGVDPSDVEVASPNGLTEADNIVITYSYADSAYFLPQIIEDYDRAADWYGNAFNADGSILSPLAAASKVAFNNGATQILTLATDPSDGTFRTQLSTAYLKVVNDPRVATITPLLVDGVSSTGTTNTRDDFLGYVSDLKAHCLAAEDNGFGRIGVAGAPKAYVESISEVAGSINSKRIMLAWPNDVVLSNGTNSGLEVDGCYLAVAYGALLVVDAVNRGLTRRRVSGFRGFPEIIRATLDETTKNSLSSSGVAVTEINRLGQLWVRHGVTTTVTNLLEREVSLVRVADVLYQNVQVGLDGSDLIGQPIDDEMTTRVTGVLSSVLERAVADGLIVEWQDLKTRQLQLPTGDPTVIECKFSYRAAVPLNYITVAFKIDLTTGTTTATTA